MNIRTLSPELQSAAINVINEVPSRIPEDIDHIRKWLTKQPHLKARTDDQWLLNFLRGCKFSLDRTKEVLENFYTTRSATPELFANRDPLQPEIKKILELGLFLPIEVQNGPKIILHRTTNVDPSEVSLVDVVKVSLMITDIMLNEDDYCIIHGQRVLFDLNTLSANHLLQATPNLCIKVLLCLKNAYPTRWKGFHFLNMPPIFESILRIGKPVIGKKLSSRIVIYSKDNIHTMYDDIPISVLPADYGGQGETIEELTVKWKRKVESYRNWFLEETQYGCDESKRMRKSKYSDLFGIEGSFRNLAID
ncbi:hypothetical protein RI129_004940 [Pyrocoelia pectoralis]|uniref:CRAL-TRIO domain-containing protein n=1 Tax=Pyrocoelia pectoralis TaxID=417401 RepID=A0AAN7ZRQ0_9COLE